MAKSSICGVSDLNLSQISNSLLSALDLLITLVVAAKSFSYLLKRALLLLEFHVESFLKLVRLHNFHELVVE